MKFLDGNICEKLGTITQYSSAYDLAADEGFLRDDMTAGFQEYLQHVDDWEAVTYFCVNHKYVICADSINGMVFDFCTAEHFMDEAVKQYTEDEGEAEAVI